MTEEGHFKRLSQEERWKLTSFKKRNRLSFRRLAAYMGLRCSWETLRRAIAGEGMVLDFNYEEIVAWLASREAEMPVPSGFDWKKAAAGDEEEEEPRRERLRSER